jgi:probable F420-dependent oxidoreductase
VKFGIRLPVPPYGPIENGPYIARFAKLVEDLGFESIWTIDHALMRVEYDSKYPYKKGGRTPLPAEGMMPDPLIAMTYLAAVTEKIRLGTAMLILPQRHPVILAKQLATLDQYCEGRLTLGIGVGWNEEEVVALGQDFKDRGRRCDEWLRIMRLLWTEDLASFKGEYHEFSDIMSQPKPAQPGGVPIMVGGHTDFAARRAGRYGDEFYPHWSVAGPDVDEFRRLHAIVRETALAAGRSEDAVAITLTGTTRRGPAELCAELGAARCVILPPGGDLDGKLPGRLERFAREVIEPLS